jgi:sulfite reductase (NADPH) hemoprotein beta-component
MYQYTEFDKQFVRARAAQHRDQLERFEAGQLTGDEFKPLRLQNGWYVQRYAPMLRVAVPYGEISAPQLNVLAQIARELPGLKALELVTVLGGAGAHELFVKFGVLVHRNNSDQNKFGASPGQQDGKQGADHAIRRVLGQA